MGNIGFDPDELAREAPAEAEAFADHLWHATDWTDDADTAEEHFLNSIEGLAPALLTEAQVWLWEHDPQAASDITEAEEMVLRRLLPLAECARHVDQVQEKAQGWGEGERGEEEWAMRRSAVARELLSILIRRQASPDQLRRRLLRA